MTDEPRLTAASIRAAIDKVNAQTYEPTSYGPLHPAQHDAINDALGRPHGTPVTEQDVNRVLLEAYEAADEAGKQRLAAAAFGILP